MIQNYFKIGNVWIGSPQAIMSRLTAIDGATVLTVGNVSSITRTIGTKAAGVWSYANPVALTVSTVISALSTSNGWSNDSVGYNFRDIVPGSMLTNPGETRIEYIVNTTDGLNATWVVEANTKNPFTN
ncbi:MAG: hypothetical protein WCH39_01655 [Schlesneria sp.]